MIKFSEKTLLTLIILTLLLPAPLTLWVHLANPSQRFDWIANRTLAGVTIKKDPAASRFSKLAEWGFSKDAKFSRKRKFCRTRASDPNL